MTVQLAATIDGARYTVQLDRPIDLSIPVRFDGERLSVFGGPPPRAEPLAVGDFIGDVNRGGSCNCDVFTFAAHTSGTHTECVGHIIGNSLITIHDIRHDVLIPATLITITPDAARDTRETYHPTPRPDDQILTRTRLEQSIEGRTPGFLEALVIRTAPNDMSKLTRNYDKSSPPYFSIEAIKFIAELPVNHLLIDTPSIDRLDDPHLIAHNIFWTYHPKDQSIHTYSHMSRTVTELIFVPDETADGTYLLDLQIAPIMSDAAPSRPVLYGIARA